MQVARGELVKKRSGHAQRYLEVLSHVKSIEVTLSVQSVWLNQVSQKGQPELSVRSNINQPPSSVLRAWLSDVVRRLFRHSTEQSRAAHERWLNTRLVGQRKEPLS